MLSQTDYLVIEYPVGPEAGFDAHGPRYVRGARYGFGPKAGDGAQREHSLGPVDERQSLLVRQLERFESRGAQRVGCGTYLSLELDGALADERQSEMREQGKVA